MFQEPETGNIAKHFSKAKDTRIDRTKRHGLLDIIIAIYGRNFMEWVQAVNELTQGLVIAIDGKQLRGSHDNGAGKNAIYMVSAWATENQLVLGHLYEDIHDLCADNQQINYARIPHSYARMVKKDHGCIEIRQPWTISDPEYLTNIRDLKRWEGIQILMMSLKERHIIFSIGKFISFLILS